MITTIKVGTGTVPVSCCPSLRADIIVDDSETLCQVLSRYFGIDVSEVGAAYWDGNVLDSSQLNRTLHSLGAADNRHHFFRVVLAYCWFKNRDIPCPSGA